MSSIICCSDEDSGKEWIECDECVDLWHYDCLIEEHNYKLEEIRCHEDGGDI